MRSAALALVLAGTLVGPAAATTAQAIDAAVREAQSKFQIPGLSAAVLIGGRLVYAKGFGLTDVASRSAAGADTVYPLGSISKQFTAAGVLNLAESEKLALADPVALHVPEYWPHGSVATLEHPPRHTSGVREFFAVPAAAKLIDDPRGTIDDVMARVALEPLAFATGSRWSYSYSGYHLATRVIEKSAGGPYERYLATMFFAPLQRSSLHHCNPAPQPPRAATGYGRRKGKVEAMPWENINTARGDGGLCGNAVGLARWLWRLAHGEVVGTASAEQLARPTTTTDGRTAPYGMGLGLLPLESRPRISHAGAIGGFSAAAAYYPRDDLAIAVLTNLAGVPAEAIERSIARSIIGLPAPRVADLPVSAELHRRVLGHWEIGLPGFVIDVADAGGRPAVRMPVPGWRGGLRYQGNGRFASAQASDVRYLQLPDGATIDVLTIGMGGMAWNARHMANDGERE